MAAHRGRHRLHRRSPLPFAVGSLGAVATRLPALLGALLAAPAASRFSRQDFAPEENCTVRLGIAGLPPARCARRIDRDATLPVWNASLDFDFGRLSEAEFNLLRQTYSAWWAADGDVPYNASRRYLLTDLLPPPIQALQGFVFVAEEKPRPSGHDFPYPVDEVFHTYKNSFLVPNCWSTVYEVLRFAASRRAVARPAASGAPYFVYSTGDQPIIAWLNGTTTHVDGPEDDLGLPSTRQPGDIVFVWIVKPKRWDGSSRLVHALLLVDKNIVFEKAGTGDTTPFRLIDLNTVHKAWDPLLFRYEVRRPKLGHETAQGPQQRFSIAGTPRSASWPEFWAWPEEAQRRFALGVADDDDGSISCITLLEIEEHRLRRNGCRWELELPPAEAEVAAPPSPGLPAAGLGASAASAGAKRLPLSARGGMRPPTIVV